MAVTEQLHKLGVYGGAFDPPHAAHLALAQAASLQLGLDELRIVPTGDTWHREAATSLASHRLAMAKLAFEGESPPGCAWTVDDRELRRQGPSYTIDTLLELHGECATRLQICLILGQDQYESLAKWHRGNELRQYATICVANRGRGHWTYAQNGLRNQQDCMIDLPELPDSATRIRDCVQRGLAIDSMVKPSVARYIASHHLYAPLNRAPV